MGWLKLCGVHEVGLGWAAALISRARSPGSVGGSIPTDPGPAPVLSLRGCDLGPVLSEVGWGFCCCLGLRLRVSCTPQLCCPALQASGLSASPDHGQVEG